MQRAVVDVRSVVEVRAKRRRCGLEEHSLRMGVIRGWARGG